MQPIRALVFAAALTCLPLVPATAFAGPDCNKVCSASDRECVKGCEKGDAECLEGCKENAKFCPESCEAVMRHQGNPAAMGEALRQSFQKQKAREAPEEIEAAEQGHRP